MYSTSVLNDKKRKADGSDTDYSASDSTSASASDADANSIASEASATRSSRNSIAAAAPKRIYIRKPAKTRASQFRQCAFDDIKTLLEQQALLWKHHANAIENAITSGDATATTAALTEQQPWSGLNYNSSIFPPTESDKPNEVLQLTQQLDDVQNRSYKRQAIPGKSVDEYEQSSEEEDEADER
jgi:hypothetical protein